MPSEPYSPPVRRPPERPGLRALARVRRARSRRRWAIIGTTIVSAVCVAALVMMIGLRPAPPEPKTVQIPSADVDAAAEPSEILVTVRGGAVLLEGVEVARTDEVAAGARIQKVDGLFTALKQRHFDHPGPRPTVVLDVAEDTPAVVVKSVFQTTAFAGYSDIQFTSLRRDAAAP